MRVGRLLLAAQGLILCAQAATIVYSGRHYAPSGKSFHQLYLFDTVTGESRRLTNTRRDHLHPAPSSDGRTITFRSTSKPRLAPGQWDALDEIWIFDMATGAERLLRKDDEPVAKTPDCRTTISRFPERSEHWNYAMSCQPSPAGSTLLVGSQAGSSSDPHEAYWLYTPSGEQWRYLASCAGARWSPAADAIVCATPRTMEPFETGRVWSSHIMVVDPATGQSRTLTSGTSYNLHPSWVEGK
jgi:Tol biopolymer transport system component